MGPFHYAFAKQKPASKEEALEPCSVGNASRRGGTASLYTASYVSFPNPDQTSLCLQNVAAASGECVS